MIEDCAACVEDSVQYTATSLVKAIVFRTKNGKSGICIFGPSENNNNHTAACWREFFSPLLNIVIVSIMIAGLSLVSATTMSAGWMDRNDSECRVGRNVVWLNKNSGSDVLQKDQVLSYTDKYHKYAANISEKQEIIGQKRV